MQGLAETETLILIYALLEAGYNEGDTDTATHELMSCDNTVACLNIPNDTIIGLRVVNPFLVPVGVRGLKSFNGWFRSRRIPASREHLNDLPIDAAELVEQSLALSLSDSYWVRPINSDLNWASVNFFSNDFSDDVGRFLLGEIDRIDSFFSPSNTTDGVFPKKWIIRNGTRYLVKADSENSRSPISRNEVFAFKIGKLLGLDVVPYFKMSDTSCACPCFVKNGQNLVSAYNLLMHQYDEVRENDTKVLYSRLCELMGKRYIDGVILLDYIIMNHDRHLKNFGILQNAKTGGYIKPAPIFDNGSSMFTSINWVKELPFEHTAARSRPFCETHDEQIALVDLSPFIDKLIDLERAIQDVFIDTYNDNLYRNIYSVGDIDDMSVLMRRRVRNVINTAKPLAYSVN